MEIEDPFVYTKPEWLKELQREKRRAARAKRLNRVIGKWGGSRKGAGRKRERPYDAMVYINHTRIQLQILLDMGNGDLNAGVQKLIDENL
jgi:hypothetical protein